MSDSPIVSIIVPVYNTEQYISRCLESLINQTFQNIEIICVNDGSPDNAPAICEKYAQNDSRIVLLSQTNQGLSAARNTGLSHARGEYIQFCDSDDYFEPEMCEQMYMVISSMDVDIVMSNINLVYEDMPPWPDENWFCVPFCGASSINNDLFSKINVYVWNKIFKRKLINEFNIIFPYGLHYEDTAFLFKYLMVSKSIYCIDQPLYNYVRRRGSIVSATMNDKVDYAIDHIYVIHDVARFMENNELLPKFEQVFVWMTLVYTKLCFLQGGEKIFKKSFEAGAELLQKTDFNTVMFENHYRDDIIRLYALKKNDIDLYFSMDRLNDEFERLRNDYSSRFIEIEMLNAEKQVISDEIVQLKNENHALVVKFDKLLSESRSFNEIQNLTFDKRFSDGLYIQTMRAYLLFPWYIYKVFCLTYLKALPVRSMGNLLKAYLFFPYYILKVYLTLLMRKEQSHVK